MITQENLIAIGHISKPHGISGKLELAYLDGSYTDLAFEYVFLKIDGIFIPYFIEEMQTKTRTSDIVKFYDVDTEQQALTLKEYEVFVESEQLSTDDDDDFHISQLVGYTLIDHTDAQVVGTICGVDTSSVNTLLNIKDSAERTFDIPFHPDLMIAINPQEKQLTLQLPEGLLSILLS